MALATVKSSLRDSQPLFLKGTYVTLERVNPSHIPSLFASIGFPENNSLVDWITGFPYIYSETDLSNHIFDYLKKHPELTIYAIKACQSHLNPPSPPDAHSHTSALGICGYRLYPESRSAITDDFVFSPLLQNTYVATEAHYLILLNVFEGQALKYQRLGLTTNALNEKTVRYAKRLGYEFEGRLRKEKLTRWNTPRDTDCFSMLDTEWPSNRKAFESWLHATNFATDGKQIRSLSDVRAEQVKSLL